MSADVIQFVDSIDAKPVVRLDLNDDDVIRCRTFLAPPPRLRRSMSQNVMTDGGFVSSSQYGTRVLYIDLDLITIGQDENAAYLQKLARELDRETNIIRYQPAGASRPVFFKVWRSDFSALVDMKAVLAFRQASLEIVAEPFALGLRESIPAFTVALDPAAGSNPVRCALPTILGDVSAPLLLDFGFPVLNPIMVATSRNQNPSAYFSQLETETMGTDTTHPAGGPDAAMSGTATNNYARTSFATTTTMVTRVLVTNIPNVGGRYRVLVAVRLSATPTSVNIKMDVGDPVAIVSSTTRYVYDLGVRDFPDLAVGETGVTSVPTSPTSSQQLQLSAERTSGTGSLDWDCVIFIPADEQVLISTMAGTTNAGVIDGTTETCASYTSGVATDGTATNFTLESSVGVFPYVTPGVTNYLYAHKTDAAVTVGLTQDFDAVYYWPRYLHVRPVSS